jgi:hypothetical protein
MNALVDRKPRPLYLPRLKQGSQGDAASLGPMCWVRWAGLALLAAYLLFCHGCHGDEDNELLASRGLEPPSARSSQ